VQLVALKVPVELFVKLTLPAGVDEPPTLEVSLTVAVQVVCWLATTDNGEQVREVEVLL